MYGYICIQSDFFLNRLDDFFGYYYYYALSGLQYLFPIYEYTIHIINITIKKLCSYFVVSNLIYSRRNEKKSLV